MFSEYVGTHLDWDLFFLVHVQDSVVAQFGMHYWSAAFKSEIRTPCLLQSISEFRVGCEMHSHNAKSLTAVHVISKIRSVCDRIYCSSGRCLNMHFKANYGNWLQSTFHISNLESVGAMHCTSEAQTCLQYEFHVRSWLRSSQINQTVGLV